MVFDYLGHQRVDGRKLVGVRIRNMSTDLTQHFDARTFLLARSRRDDLSNPINGKPMEGELAYDNYQTIDGIPMPTQFRLHIDGRSTMILQITEARFSERIDDADFGWPD
jgi:hypothetical protein